MESSNEEICVYLDYRYEEGADVENSETLMLQFMVTFNIHLHIFQFAAST